MNKNFSPVSLTRDLLQFDTINPPGQEKECAKFLGKLLEAGGFQVQYHEYEEGRTSLVAKIEGSSDKAPICFTGHIDTVPLGAVDWSKDPFNGETEGDRLFGRGTTDMKGGVAAMVGAALALAKRPHRKAGIVLVLTAAEETGCLGAAHLAQAGNILGKAGAIVVGEPTSNYPLIGHKGILWLEACTHGVTAHGSMPEKGDNAIYKAARAISKLETYQFDAKAHPILGNPTLNVGTISGGLNINSVPDLTKILIDIRTIPGQDNGAIHQHLQKHLGDEVEITRVMDAISIASDPEDEWMQKVFEIVAPHVKENLEPRAATYSTDATFLTPAYGNPPTVILGPGEPALAHKTDEFCHISKLEESQEIYLKIAEQWCH